MVAVPGVPTSIGIKGLSNEAGAVHHMVDVEQALAAPIFWGEMAEDPNWLLLQAEQARPLGPLAERVQVVLKWHSGSEGGPGHDFAGLVGPGPCLETDPELAWAPYNEAVLRLGSLSRFGAAAGLAVDCWIRPVLFKPRSANPLASDSCRVPTRTSQWLRC